MGALALFVGAVSVLVSFSVLSIVLLVHRQNAAATTAAVESFVTDDAASCIVTDKEGAVRHWNDAANRRFGPPPPGGLNTALTEILAQPAVTLRRMRLRAEDQGAAHEDVVTRYGQGRLSVHRLPNQQLLWRFQEFTPNRLFQDRRDGALLTVGRSNSILHMNDAARRLIRGQPKTLESLFGKLPLRSGEKHELLGTGGEQYIRVIDLGEVGGRRDLMLLEAGPPHGEKNVMDLMEILPVPLLMIAADGCIKSANAPARDLLGSDCREGARLADLTEGLGRSITDWLREAAAPSRSVHSEFLRLSNPDRETYVQVTLKKMRLDGRDVLITVLSDATELKTLEAQFVQSQKMQAIGQLAGGIAHDFNNLLTAISGYCDLMLLRRDPGDPDYSDLIQVHQNANRAASLVGQLLAFSRKQTLRPETVDLRDTLSDLTHLLNRLVGERVTLSLRHDPLLQPIQADKRQLEQVIMNLVVNARDAMSEGGEITIVTETLRLTEPLKRDRAEVTPGEYVSVKVIDSGHGIAPDQLNKVFEPFFTTKRIGEGTGLGLSTVYGIVKQTGGYIFADSTQGKGSCFTLLFPVREVESEVLIAPAPQIDTILTADSRGARLAQGVILLVEDETPVRAFASQALRLRGYTVLEADCAEAALRILEDSDLKVDIFVTDVVMPGMDGPSWVIKALEQRPGVRVVFVSGYAEEKFSAVQEQIPNSVFLPKPFSLTELTETVQRQLH
ncbi:MAG: ATP-binding protein [Pseudooceanicola sp.]|nr:PAS domain-containing hybrid sensor histidine kinase/response regulator [Pseudooceanicola sp.]MDF1856597.1 ATP-binding protein [Pseudooceanicola sp.]